MHRRMLAFVIALVVAAAPQMVLGCEMTCAAMAMSHQAGAPSHSCHHESTPDPAGTTQMTSAAHACGHTDALPSAANSDQTVAAAPAILPAVVQILSAPVDSRVFADSAHATPLDRHFRATPLRL